MTTGCARNIMIFCNSGTGESMIHAKDKPQRPEPTPRDANGLIIMTPTAQAIFDALQALPTRERDAIIQNCIAVRAAEKAEIWRVALECAEQRRASNPKQEDKRTFTKRPAYQSRGATNEGEGLI